METLIFEHAVSTNIFSLEFQSFAVVIVLLRSMLQDSIDESSFLVVWPMCSWSIRLFSFVVLVGFSESSVARSSQ